MKNLIRPVSFRVSTLPRENNRGHKHKGSNFKECVFGIELNKIPKYADSIISEEKELPKFLVKVVKSIEQKIDTVGLYRINGVASEIQSIRYV